MQFSFEVGEYEKHIVMLNYEQMIGLLTIHVDGRAVLKRLHLLSFSLVTKYECIVGVQERHHVLIERERKLFLAGLRPQKYRVYVDGQLIREYEGM